MTTFRITFLLAFSLVSKSKISKQGKKLGKGKIKKSKKSKASKSSKSKSSKRKEKPEGVPKPDYLLEVGNPIGYAHIEYEFMPGRDKQEIDVICWKGVATVFFGEDTKTYRAKLAADKIWLPIFIEHYVNTLESEELVKLHRHEINFVIYTNKNKLNSRAKSTTTKQFYLKQEDVNVDDFVPVYTEDPNLSTQEPDSDLLVNYIHNIINDCINKPGLKNKASVASKLKIHDIVHTHIVNKIINEISDGKSMRFKEFVPISLEPIAEPVDQYEEDMFPPLKKGKKTKDKKGKKTKAPKKERKKKSKSTKGNKQLAGPMKIKVSGEVFFTDPNLSMYDCKTNNIAISNGYVLISVEKLMTKLQKYELNPMVIKIDDIFNVPVDFLKQNGFKSIFVRYNIPYVARGITLEREITENIIINEAHVYFTDEIPAIKFSEFIQSKRLLIEVCGTRDQTAQKEERQYIFGEEKNDKDISKKFSSAQALHTLNEYNDFTTQPIIALAVAYYDLTSLLIPTWTFVCNESCHNPSATYQMKKSARKINFVTPNDINLCVLRKSSNCSPLTENFLTTCGMSLKLEVSMAAPMYKLMNKVLSCGDFYKRLFVIIYKYELAVFMLKEILTNNQYTKDTVIPNYLNSYNAPDLNENDYLTGFLIDNGQSYAFFIEGLTSGLIMTIWEKFMHANPYDVHTFFNNNVVFENRLYDKFLNIGGLFMITLLKPLRDILALEMIYLEGSVPLPCFQALKKLDLLFRCCTLKAILQANVLPTSDELMSLDLEFGVPLRWNKSVRTVSQIIN